MFRHFRVGKFIVRQESKSYKTRVANLGDFSPKNANLGIFLVFGELVNFLGNFESQL
jgi:hypothetical protein